MWVRFTVALVTAAVCVVWCSSPAVACPFCNADKPTLAQRRDSATVVVVAEVLPPDTMPAVSKHRTARIHTVLKGAEQLGDRRSVALPADIAPAAGNLLILLADEDGMANTEDWNWELVAADEAAIGYFARSPSLREDAAKRLKYFARYLEHPHPLLAEDAYLEFAHAPYDVVAAAADSLPMEAIRGWIEDAAVPARRKGFYGVALGLSKEPAEKGTNERLLRRLILKPAVDFRGGFDGILGGYLLAAGEPALELIEERILANPDSAEGDVRHALNALRFYHESGRRIEPARLCRAVRNLLLRPEFATAAVVDLARWQDWEAVEEIAALYQTEKSDHRRSTRRAVIGYLLVCPTDAAAAHLRRIRQRDPELVSQVEQRPILPRRGD